MQFSLRDKAKFTLLYAKYYRLMYRVSYDILHDHARAEDAVHTACVRILTHFGGVSEVDCPQTRNFVVIIVKRIALTMLCADKRALPADVLPELQADETVADAVEQKEARAKVFCAVSRLCEEDRDLIMLKYDNDFTVAQIAVAMGLTVEVVKKRLQRVRAKIKAHLTQGGYP